MMFPSTVITSTYALTGGPKQPEFNSFTPISTSDMVNLSSGDFNYNIPIMDVGGYPINLAYNSGVTTDQEATWVGLGWNLNVGQINRSVRGLPDDFDGDKMTYENNIKNNVTVGANFGLGFSAFGFGEKVKKKIKANVDISVQYNNYEGITFKPSFGPSFDVNDKIKVGFNTQLSSTEGVSVSADVSYKNKKFDGSLGVSYNSRQGLNTSLSAHRTFSTKNFKPQEKGYGGRIGGSLPITFNDYRLFTPTKRIGMNNYNFAFKATVGTTVTGFNNDINVGGFANIRSIKPDEQKKDVPAYGYEYSEDNRNGVMDFVREKERGYSKLTKVLALTNYTYDMYSIAGQGIGGAFRPYRNQVGYVYKNTVSDSGLGFDIVGEFKAGNLASTGIDIKVLPSRASTGEWRTASNAFKYKTDTKDDYEKVYFKLLTENNVDNDLSLYTNQLRESKPIAIKIKGDDFDRKLSSTYLGGGSSVTIYDRLMRSKRLLRNTAIQKITKDDALHDDFISVSPYAKKKHTAGYKILKPDGSYYVYGKALYNITKKEASFSVGGRDSGNCSTGLIDYDKGEDNSVDNEKGQDHFFNRTTTPAYAHTYLLTSILSSDYEDSDAIAGPSDGDLGTYTKFIYDDVYNYKWRVPFKEDKASVNTGFYSHPEDQKGNYIYGEREQSYIKIIETKTHVAVFHVSDRFDAYGVKGENGGKGNNSVSKKLDKIELFSKEDYYKNGTNAVPIKVAHFEYDYSLSAQVPNSVVSSENPNRGKLTLSKVFFTYGKSKMGKYTPYTFDYGQYIDDQGNEVIINPVYGLKAHDIWGNYKKNEGVCGIPNGPLNATVATNIEYPYVEQDKEVADKYATAWTLTTVHLPSGGTIKIEFESNDYQYVQRDRAMRLFEVAGVGDIETNDEAIFFEEVNLSTGLTTPCLYKSGNDADFIFIKVPDNIEAKEYTAGLKRNIVFFKFLLNMGEQLSKKYDFVTGYFYLNGDVRYAFKSGQSYLAVPMQKVDKEGGIFTSGRQVNPISKAGWYFGRNNMRRIVYSLDHSYAVGDGDNLGGRLVSIIAEMVGSLANAAEMISGPNGLLRSRDIANYFVPKKSWIRLVDPSKHKLGGGARVKKITMSDNWGSMIDRSDEYYNNIYGQEYNYSNIDGSSSGVASFEPSGSEENPLVRPIYDTESGESRERLLAPKDQNYFEGPIGESFFPSPKITYGRVVVKNLTKSAYSHHGTGSIINKFYTSYDYPTKTSFTPLKNGKSLYNDDNTLSIANIMNFSVKQHLALSQGFTIEVNDMDGKQMSQEILSEEGKLISKVTYNYFERTKDENGNRLKDGKSLVNKMVVIDKKGNISEKTIGVNYDVINDFNQSISSSETYGVGLNMHSFIVAVPLAIPTIVPDLAFHENELHVATTTKVVQRHGILKEKVVYDLGARVSTENLAWDAQTGQVIVTKTQNEFNDAYYSTSYPAYWFNDYAGMQQASINLGIEGLLTYTTANNTNSFVLQTNNFSDSDTKFITVGDELNIYTGSGIFVKKVWVLKVAKVNNDTKLTLIDQYGNDFADCHSSLIGNSLRYKVVRSGYRNLSSSAMANITGTENPIRDAQNNLKTNIHTNAVNDRVINASAVVYNDFWASQCESDLPHLTQDDIDVITSNGQSFSEDTFVNKVKGKFNPFVYNVRGDWRARESYAFLTGRTQTTSNVDPRNDGFYETFSPYYSYNNNEWEINQTNAEKWTTASTITKFSPFGVELENKDALDRYSAAQYGYDYTLPTAVASNTQYREIAFDGFEDHKPVNEIHVYGQDYFHSFPRIEYSNINITQYNKHHFNYEDAIAKNENSERSSVAHTGRYSVKLNPNTKLSLIKKLGDCENIEPMKGCEHAFITEIYKNGQINAITTESHIDACTKVYDITFDGDNYTTNGQVMIKALNATSNLEIVALFIGGQRQNISSNPFNINRSLVFANGYNNDFNNIKIVVKNINNATDQKVTISFAPSSTTTPIIINVPECGI